MKVTAISPGDGKAAGRRAYLDAQQAEHCEASLAQAIIAAAEHLTAAGRPPSVAAVICPDSFDAAALRSAMEMLATGENGPERTTVPEASS